MYHRSFQCSLLQDVSNRWTAEALLRFLTAIFVAETTNFQNCIPYFHLSYGIFTRIQYYSQAKETINTTTFFQIFQVLEFPNEEESMTTLQNLVIFEREDFLKKIYNMTSGLNPEEMEALKSYIFYGPDFDSSDYDVRTIMLNTNRLVPDQTQRHTQVLDN